MLPNKQATFFQALELPTFHKIAVGKLEAQRGVVDRVRSSE